MSLTELKAIEAVPVHYFETRESGIDQEKTKELGYPVPRLTHYITIVPWHTPRGEGQEFEAEPWLAQKRIDASSGRYNRTWVDAFLKSFENYKVGKDVHVDGIPLISYERIAKKRREELAFIFPTLEALASVPDSALSNIGLDGRVLRDLARADIQAKKDLSPLVQELADANELIRRQEEMIASMEERLNKLEVRTKKRDVAA